MLPVPSSPRRSNAISIFKEGFCWGLTQPSHAHPHAIVRLFRVMGFCATLTLTQFHSSRRRALRTRFRSECSRHPSMVPAIRHEPLRARPHDANMITCARRTRRSHDMTRCVLHGRAQRRTRTLTAPEAPGRWSARWAPAAARSRAGSRPEDQGDELDEAQRHEVGEMARCIPAMRGRLFVPSGEQRAHDLGG